MLDITIKSLKPVTVSMRWKMILTYFAVILITLILMSIYIFGVLRNGMYKNETATLYAKANIAADEVCGFLASPEHNNPDDISWSALQGTGIRGMAITPSYTVICDSNTEASLVGKQLLRDVVGTAMAGTQADGVYKVSDGKNIMMVAVPVTSQNKFVGVVYLNESLDEIDSLIGYVRMNMFIVSAIISILVGLLSMGMSYAVTMPLDEFIKVAGDISKGNYKTRINISGNDEFAQLSIAMNSMCEELENIDETQKKFISDVSHELKTPLASIKLICDSIVDSQEPDIEMIREFLGDLSNEVDRLTRIVQRLLTLTKISNDEQQPSLTPVDFTVMLNAVVSKLKPNAESKRIDLSIGSDINELAPILIDYDKIWEAIYNITDNAIKYTPEDGIVSVSLNTDGKEIAVSISDSGSGIQPEEREKIFERFYRLDDSRARETGGTGLGLAIAKEAVTMHNGRIEVSESDFGGSTFTIYLPCPKPEKEVGV